MRLPTYTETLAPFTHCENPFVAQVVCKPRNIWTPGSPNLLNTLSLGDQQNKIFLYFGGAKKSLDFQG